MARQAILSDIHANLVALEAALADCAAQDAAEIVCLGDIVGYGPEPAECVDRLRDCCAWSLSGNHDAALFMIHPCGFNRLAREALAWQITRLKPGWCGLASTRRRWRWLRELKPLRLQGQVLYVHASPRDPLLEYIEEADVMDLGCGPSRKIYEVFSMIPGICFCGHSHRPGVATDEYLWLRPQDLEDSTFRLAPERKAVVNVGSVGQPRDGDPRLCYVIYDSEARTVRFRRLEYDLGAAQARFRRVMALDERIAERLARGR